MFMDFVEIVIIVNVKQKNVCDFNCFCEYFFNIFEDFFEGVELMGCVVDFGFGQFDFGEIVCEWGGQCLGIDFDLVVFEFGCYKGFDVFDFNFKKFFWYDFDEIFDGVFNKFFLNVFWMLMLECYEVMVVVIVVFVFLGWVWIVLWNGVFKLIDYFVVEIEEIFVMQRCFFEGYGFYMVEFDEVQICCYGVYGIVVNNFVFFKKLCW